MTQADARGRFGQDMIEALEIAGWHCRLLGNRIEKTIASLAQIDCLTKQSRLINPGRGDEPRQRGDDRFGECLGGSQPGKQAGQVVQAVVGLAAAICDRVGEVDAEVAAWNDNLVAHDAQVIRYGHALHILTGLKVDSHHLFRL